MAVRAAVAQIHATLALAAATALGKRDIDNRAWADTVGTGFIHCSEKSYSDSVRGRAVAQADSDVCGAEA